MDSKQCTKCGEVKPIGEFYKQAGGKDGLRADCKPCKRSKSNADYHSSPETRREWEAANSSKLKKQRDAYYWRKKGSGRERLPRGYWTLEKCSEDAANYNTKNEWRLASPTAYSTAAKQCWLDKCCEHMQPGWASSDNDVVYIWRDSGSDLHKIGVTSDRVGEERIEICRRHNDMDPRIVFMLKVSDARAVESQLLELGTDPELDSSIDGYTEFRRLTDAELGQAVSIAYEAALAA